MYWNRIKGLVSCGMLPVQGVCTRLSNTVYLISCVRASASSTVPFKAHLPVCRFFPVLHALFASVSNYSDSASRGKTLLPQFSLLLAALCSPLHTHHARSLPFPNRCQLSQLLLLLLLGSERHRFFARYSLCLASFSPGCQPNTTNRAIVVKCRVLYLNTRRECALTALILAGAVHRLLGLTHTPW